MGGPLRAGLDGGGTQTRLLVTDGQSTVYEATAGPTNWSSTPPAEIESAVTELAQKAPKVKAVAGCFAGLLTAAQADQARSLLTRSFGTSRCTAVADYAAALRACDDRNALLVISGTGSLVASRTSTGHLVKSGGGGPLLGDVGSGYAVGRLALQQWIHRKSMSELFAHTLWGFFGTENPDEAVAGVYRSARPATEIARLGGAIAELATDEVSTLLDGQMQALAEIVLNHIRCFHPQQSPLVYRAGGFWNASKSLISSFETALGAKTQPVPNPPVYGAVALAGDLLL